MRKKRCENMKYYQSNTLHSFRSVKRGGKGDSIKKRHNLKKKNGVFIVHVIPPPPPSSYVMRGQILTRAQSGFLTRFNK